MPVCEILEKYLDWHVHSADDGTPAQFAIIVAT